MPELMTEEAFLLLVRELWTIAKKRGDSNAFEAAWKAVRGAYRTAYSAALAAQPDPRVTALVEALERINTLALSAYDLDIKTQGDELRGIINQIGRWAVNSIGEPAAERPWTRSEERMPELHHTVLARKIGETRTHQWYSTVVDGVICWGENDYDTNSTDLHEIAGTEWRPVEG